MYSSGDAVLCLPSLTQISPQDLLTARHHMSYRQYVLSAKDVDPTRRHDIAAYYNIMTARYLLSVSSIIWH